MRYRDFGRTGWQVSEVGYGMWGMAGWTGSEDEQSFEALDLAIELGCNFFDTAWAYGDGHSERLLGATLKRHPGKRLYVATKIPPKNRKWPARPGYQLNDVFPADYIREYTEKSLRNIGVSTLDLQQLHVWSDEWAADSSWQRALRALKDEGLVRALGISVNRWQPANVLRALDTGLIDAVQVVYNVFDQNPEDELFPVLPETRHRDHRARTVRRRQPHRNADGSVDLADGRLPQPLLQSREPCGDAAASREAENSRSARHDNARTGAAAHPGASGGFVGHPGNAQATARAAEHRPQRRQAPPGCPDDRVERAPLGALRRL